MMEYLKTLGYNTLKRFFKDKTEIAIFLLSFLVEIAFGFYLVYRWGSTFAPGSIFGGDMGSHLYIARTVVDNGVFGGFQNLGTVWLPMFHLLVMPLVFIDPLYTTGFAGTIINALATGGICVILYRLIGEKRLGILASALFMCNAFTLVTGATPMTEQTAIFFMALTAYYFKSYWEKDDLAEFMKCSLALIFGTLTRYEVWIVVFIVIILFASRELKDRRKYRIAYIHLPLWGIFAWLFWNLAIFRDPFMFINHPLSTQAQASIEISPFTGSVLLTSNFVIHMLTTISGALWIFALLSVIIFSVRKKTSQTTLMLLLISPIPFHWYIWFTGLLGVGPPILGVKFFYMGYIGLIVASLFLVSVFKNKMMLNKLMVITILTAYFISIPTQTSTILAIEPTPLYKNEVNEVEMIKEVIGENIVLWNGAAQFSVTCGVSPSQIIDDYDGSLFLKAMEKPWNYCSFVVIQKTSSNSAGIKAINDYYGGKYYVFCYHNDDVWRSNFLKHYKLVLETEHFLLYQKVD